MSETDKTKPYRVNRDGETTVYLGKVGFKVGMSRKKKAVKQVQPPKTKSLALKG